MFQWMHVHLPTRTFVHNQVVVGRGPSSLWYAGKPLRAKRVPLFSAPEQLGKYQLFKRIAVGGMAEVYVGRAAGPAGFSKLVAVKRIHPHLATHAAFVEMFLDEARLAAQLDHPNIVQLIDLGQAGEDYFLAMEFIRGKTLREVIDRTHELGQPLDLPAVLTIALGVLNGLGFAHGRRGLGGEAAPVVHRDVSPQNILVGYNGTVKLADFGIAKAQDRVHVTNAGVIKGKAFYMAPEQMFEGKADARADIFSCGVVFHEMLTGRRLFGKYSQSQLFNPAIRKDVKPPSALLPSRPQALDPIVLKMIERQPEARFGSSAEVIRALEQCMLGLRVMGSTESLAASMRMLFAIEAEQEERDLTSWAHQTGMMPQPAAHLPAQRAPAALPTREEQRTRPGPLRPPQRAAEVWPEMPTTVRPVEQARTRPHVSPPPRPVHDAATQLHVTPVQAGNPRHRVFFGLASFVVGAVALALFIWIIWPSGSDKDARATHGSSGSGAPGSETLLPIDRGATARSSRPDVGQRVALRTPTDPPRDPQRKTNTTEPEVPPKSPQRPDKPSRPTTPNRRTPRRPASSKGMLELASSPTGLDIYAGRRRLGRTPASLRLKAGRHRLRLRSTRLGIDRALTVRIAANRSLRQSVRIGKGRLRVNGVPWANVYVDGRQVGVTPMRALNLYAGKHLVELRHPPSRGHLRRWIKVAEGGNHLVMHDFRKGTP